MQQSDRHCEDITRDTDTLRPGQGENIAVRSTLCRHNKRSRTVCRRANSSQIDILQTQKRSPTICRSGENTAVRSTLRRHQTRSFTSCRRAENKAVRSTLRRHQTRSCTGYRNTAVRLTFCRHQKGSRTFCRRERAVRVVNKPTSNDITYNL